MKKMIIILTTILYSCSSIDLPDTEISDKFIKENKPKFDAAEQFIKSKTNQIQSNGSDINLNVSVGVINKFVKKVAFDKEKDIIFKFHETKNLVKEEKNILGINYTNNINIEHGYVDVNLKNIEFEKLVNNIAVAEIEIDGNGEVSVSGKHSGVAASVTGDIRLYLKEKVKFKLITTDSGNVVLIPQRQKLKLKTKISVELLKWNIPWYEEIELELADIIPPISIPLAISTKIDFPLPSEVYKKDAVKYVPYNIEFSNSKLSADKDKINLRTDLIFKRK